MNAVTSGLLGAEPRADGPELPAQRARPQWSSRGASQRTAGTGSDRRLHVLFVCSGGGHLAQLHQLRDWWGGHGRSWVTFRMADSESLLAEEKVHWAFHPTTRNVPNLLRNLWLAWRVLRTERPDVVVTTGAGVAAPFFLLARLRGIRTVYLEVYDRIYTPTLTARLCYRFTDLFLLQWEEQRQHYPDGIVVGRTF